MKIKTKFDMGDELESKITGFRGVATGICEYINGCRQYLLKPRVDKDGKDVEGIWIDEQVLFKTGAKKLDLSDGQMRGGPRAEAPPV